MTFKKTSTFIPDEDFDDFPPPSDRQNPLLTRRLKGGSRLVNPRKKFNDLSPPSRKQNPLATRTLTGKDTGLVDQKTQFSDFAPPSRDEVSVGQMLVNCYHILGCFPLNICKEISF